MDYSVEHWVRFSYCRRFIPLPNSRCALLVPSFWLGYSISRDSLFPLLDPLCHACRILGPYVLSAWLSTPLWCYDGVTASVSRDCRLGRPSTEADYLCFLDTCTGAPSARALPRVWLAAGGCSPCGTSCYLLDVGWKMPRDSGDRAD